jgi:uncharacterized membrane protein HdeD (DUF308 family)
MQEDAMWAIRVTEGIVAVLFGIAAVFWPGLTIITLLYLFAGFILVSGIINLFTGIFHFGEGAGTWILKVLLAFLQVGIGIYLLRHPHVSFATLILLIGFALIFRGVFEIVSAFMEDLSAAGRSTLIIVGALALLSGIIVLFQPVAGGVAFVWILGLYALIMGPMTIASALNERNAARRAPARR